MRGVLVRGTYFAFNDDYDSRVHDDGASSLEIDLRSARFIDAYWLVVMGCLIEDAQQRGVPVTFHKPANRSCSNYISRMGLGEQLDRCGYRHDLPPVGSRDLPGRLVELQPFETSDDVSGLCEIIYSRLSDNYRTSRVAGELYEAVWELGGNALEHAGRDRGLIAAQVYNRGKPNQYLVFAIGDAGIGIRRSLESAGYEPDGDLEAVDLALENDVSASREPGRGQGLPDVVSLLRDCDGRVRLRTGSANVFHAAGRRRGKAMSHLNGTIASAYVLCGAAR